MSGRRRLPTPRSLPGPVPDASFPFQGLLQLPWRARRTSARATIPASFPIATERFRTPAAATSASGGLIPPWSRRDTHRTKRTAAWNDAAGGPAEEKQDRFGCRAHGSAGANQPMGAATEAVLRSRVQAPGDAPSIPDYRSAERGMSSSAEEPESVEPHRSAVLSNTWSPPTCWRRPPLHVTGRTW